MLIITNQPQNWVHITGFTGCISPEYLFDLARIMSSPFRLVLPTTVPTAPENPPRMPWFSFPTLINFYGISNVLCNLALTVL